MDSVDSATTLTSPPTGPSVGPEPMGGGSSAPKGESHSSIATSAMPKNGKQTFLEWLEEFLVAQLPQLLLHMGEWVVKGIENFFKATGLVTPSAGPVLVAPEWQAAFDYYKKFYHEMYEGENPDASSTGAVAASDWGKELTTSYPELCTRLNQEKDKIAAQHSAKGGNRLSPEELRQQVLESLLKREKEGFLHWLRDMLKTDIARLPPAYRDRSATSAYWRIVEQIPSPILNGIFDVVNSQREKPLTRSDDPRGPILAALVTLGCSEKQ